ncbi:MAG TPA: LON peptidase substrate-binding domain-containing protein [Gaiella sp.]|nr:LON peptidase substrate-binding domain-containing protein [Gaiella sp.]
MEVGLFPLGLVLLPTEQVPLHIFEPRYRELIGECLERDEPFGLVFADDDGVRRVGTLANVVEVTDRFDDGRLNIVVEGGERFRLVELTDGRSFHTGTIEPLDDVDDPPADEDVERALAVFRRLVELTGADVEVPKEVTGRPSFEIGSRFELAPELKLELLEEPRERVRLVRLCEILEALAAAVERQREIAELASRNGRVKTGDG